MKTLAWIELGLAFLAAVIAPSLQGRPQIRTAANTVAAFVGFCLQLVLMGRILEWW